MVVAMAVGWLSDMLMVRFVMLASFCFPLFAINMIISGHCPHLALNTIISGKYVSMYSYCSVATKYSSV